jgi:hypothetical protein
VAADITIGKMHCATARMAVEAVAMEASMTALRVMCNDATMVSLEAPRSPCASYTMASSSARPRPRRRCTSTTPRARSRRCCDNRGGRRDDGVAARRQRRDRGGGR